MLISSNQLFKIPHHGSENAHSHEVWDKMLDRDTIGLLTSKVGGSAISKNSDIRRLKTYTSNLFSTSVPITKKGKYDPSVEKTIKGVMKERRLLYGDMGHIQLRFGNNLDAVIRLKKPAKAL